ncbi:hypothetical protein T4C_8263 [Trichinella pseudospiralis]|uniref:Uncharacterized protein n=1 Tax=Trichinella pseudospiralis TaxID=6337 RepID=A0A0V1GX20_TRIPS|nr:hypothetical protein T4C_8263 [Trichinella pseudospiralis]
MNGGNMLVSVSRRDFSTYLGMYVTRRARDAFIELSSRFPID